MLHSGLIDDALEERFESRLLVIGSGVVLERFEGIGELGSRDGTVERYLCIVVV